MSLRTAQFLTLAVGIVVFTLKSEVAAVALDSSVKLLAAYIHNPNSSYAAITSAINDGTFVLP